MEGGSQSMVLRAFPAESGSAGGCLRREPPAGTPLKCALAGGMVADLAHSGVYLGGGTVAELDGDGRVQAVALSEFLNGAAGARDWAALRSGFRIYAACDRGSGRPVGGADVAERARRATAGTSLAPATRRYQWLRNNCHRFTAECVDGNWDAGKGGTWRIGRLEEVVSRCLNGGRDITWRPVDFTTPGFTYSPTPGKRKGRAMVQEAAAVGVVGFVAVVAATTLLGAGASPARG